MHLVPSGILQPRTVNLIGPGVVVDPRVLLKELDEINAAGALRDPSRVRLSGRAHVILDWHTALDKARDEAREGGAIGTTGRGIGPTYEDKVARRGIRVADLLDPPSLRKAIERLAKEKNFELTQIHKWDPIDAEAVFDEYVASSPTWTTPAASSIEPSARERTYSSRAPRGPFSTSITAPIPT
jgi:adenylosuccinate synthase